MIPDQKKIIVFLYGRDPQIAFVQGNSEDRQFLQCTGVRKSGAIVSDGALDSSRCEETLLVNPLDENITDKKVGQRVISLVSHQFTDIYTDWSTLAFTLVFFISTCCWWKLRSGISEFYKNVNNTLKSCHNSRKNGSKI